jgi:phenylalanyl-tRNA synthetase alpha chain
MNGDLDKKIVGELVERAQKGDHSVLRSPQLRSLFDQIKTIPPEQRSEFGKEINKLKDKLRGKLEDAKSKNIKAEPIDITAPWGVNTKPEERPALLSAENGSINPLSRELDEVLDIYARMGFSAIESRQIDDDYHMFGSLNFPEGHPARDDYDTFVTVEKDKKGRPLVAPAHTSTMQNRVLRANKDNLKSGEPIAYVIPGRVFRNEDLDVRHEHTFHQLEGIYVGKGVHAGMLIATLKAFLEEYYHQSLEVKTQPFYFPFTEPSFEFALSCPFCQKAGCNICKYSGWIELLGCGMIHPNVLKEAGIDPKVYTGFAWGGGLERLVMMKYGIEDVRHFHSGKLNFLRQFS